jgi:hypothetical protein
MIQDAEVEFHRAMQDSQNLIAIHRELNPGPGRVTRELSLNRAVVVLTVAAWQAFVQDVLEEALALMERPKGDPGREHFLIVKASALTAAGNFSTPNAENTRKLLLHVGFDPLPHWAWKAGPATITPGVARERMNHWLGVRHAIAHGDDELPDYPVLNKLKGGGRSLTRANAEACIRFFGTVVKLTSVAASNAFQ